MSGHAAALVVALLVTACDGKPPASAQGDEAAAQQASYLAPPRVDAVRSTANGVVLSGAAPAGGKVRLATPAGQATFTTADPRGRWTMVLPPAVEPRIFGLSVTTGQRQAQAEGYVLVTPAGQAALLRAGAGALRIDPPLRPGLRAIDFDRGGGLEVSATAPPGATVIVRLDDRQVAEGRANPSGRYEASLGTPTPIRPGTHKVQLFGDGFSDQAVVEVSPAAPLAEGPLRSQLTSAGLRVDWMTPGGGEQSTLLIH
ncbi:MAG: hypothetical protein ACHP9T_16250 [Caulobacterales bacterium]